MSKRIAMIAFAPCASASSIIRCRTCSRLATNAFVIPFGAGVSASYDHFLIDARFTYRGVFDDKLVAAGNNDSLDLQNWSAGLTVGYQL